MYVPTQIQISHFNAPEFVTRSHTLIFESQTVTPYSPYYAVKKLEPSTWQFPSPILDKEVSRPKAEY